MPMYVCDRDGILFCHRMLVKGDIVINDFNPNPASFHELGPHVETEKEGTTGLRLPTEKVVEDKPKKKRGKK